MEFSVQQIAHLLGGTVQGDASQSIRQLAKIQEAEAGSIAFLANPKYEAYIYTTKATAVIVNEDFEPRQPLACSLILVKDAYTAFSTLLEEYQKALLMSKKGIEQPSFVAASATVEEGVYVGAFSYIGENTRLAANSKVYPQCYIGDNVRIGQNTVIYAGVKIYANTVIGDHCTVHSGAVIGSDGFGFAPQEDGSYKAIPQIGNVILEDHVSIGANTVIDCATMGSTIVRQGAKLDNLIQVAHNVVIGENTVIAAQTGISGSTEIGKGCMIGGQVGFAGHLKIAERTYIGAQAGVGTNTRAGEQLQGSPAFELRTFQRASILFRKLPDLYRKLDELEKKL